MSNVAVALPPPLREGDHLDSIEFLRRWEAMPELHRAEPINGVVFMASPVFLNHGTAQMRMAAWLFAYGRRTPGCHGAADATWVMGPKDTPQPDGLLRILPEWGGQSKNDGNYGGGAPELIIEVCGSSLSRDLGIKLELYQRAGVHEYLTVQLNPRLIVWRQLTRGRYRELKADDDGILCVPASSPDSGWIPKPSGTAICSPSPSEASLRPNTRPS